MPGDRYYLHGAQPRGLLGWDPGNAPGGFVGNLLGNWPAPSPSGEPSKLVCWFWLAWSWPRRAARNRLPTLGRIHPYPSGYFELRERSHVNT